MKKSNQFLIIISLLIVTSCGSVKVGDTWKSENFNALVGQKILVVTKGKDVNIGKSLEKEIAVRLRNMGIDAVESYLKYPSLLESKLQNNEEHDKIIEKFKNDGIAGIVVTALKDVKVKTEILKEGGYASYSTPANKAFISFRAYNNDFNNLNSPPPLPPLNSPEQTTVTKSTTYFLEAITYNLSLEEEKQLVGIIQADVTDPENSEEVIKGFSKIVAKQFKK